MLYITKDNLTKKFSWDKNVSVTSREDIADTISDIFINKLSSFINDMHMGLGFNKRPAKQYIKSEQYNKREDSFTIDIYLPIHEANMYEKEIEEKHPGTINKLMELTTESLILIVEEIAKKGWFVTTVGTQYIYEDPIINIKPLLDYYKTHHDSHKLYRALQKTLKFIFKYIIDHTNLEDRDAHIEIGLEKFIGNPKIRSDHYKSLKNKRLIDKVYEEELPDLTEILNTDNVYLYHVAPKRYISSILKKGILPKAGSKLVVHPERVYLTISVRDAEDIGTMIIRHEQKILANYPEIAKNRGITHDDTEYAIIMIDPKKLNMRVYEESTPTPEELYQTDKHIIHTFYQDPAYNHGYYTTEPIPKTAIKGISYANSYED
jgi:hypothetical protein